MHGLYAFFRGLDMTFQKDLEQSRKTVEFVARYFRELQFDTEIDYSEPENENHPPDILLHLHDSWIFALEVKEDARSLETGNLYFEKKAIMSFSKTCLHNYHVPFLVFIPYLEPRPIVLLLCDELRDDFNLLLEENIVRKVRGGDFSDIGYICPLEEVKLLRANITERLFSESVLQKFEKEYREKFFVEENHFFTRYSSFSVPFHND